MVVVPGGLPEFTDVVTSVVLIEDELTSIAYQEETKPVGLQACTEALVILLVVHVALVLLNLGSTVYHT
jgi:hypothetical protein